MTIDENYRLEIINKFKLHDTDTGSCEVQIVDLTLEIRHLTSHFNVHKKDFHSRVGLKRKIERRKRLLNYIKGKEYNKYLDIIGALNIRK